MSGPKTSVYELSAWARNNIAVQQQCILSTAMHIDEIKQTLFEMSGMKEKIRSAIDNMELSVKRIGEGGELLSSLHDLNNRMDKEYDVALQRLQNISIPTEMITLSDEALAERTVVLEKVNSVRTGVTSLFHQITGQIEEAAAQQDQYKEKISKSIMTDYASGISEESFATLTINKRKDDHQEGAELLAKMEVQFDSAIHNQSISETLKKEILNSRKAVAEIKNYDYLKNYYAVSFQSLMKKIDAEQKKWVRQKQAYHTLLERYRALCKWIGKEAEEIPQSDAAMQTLPALITKMEKQMIRRKEQEYISDCMDQVMREMGYNLLGKRNVRKKNGTQLNHELFSFSEGTAVNITYASDGQITMELGGIDSNDRIPTGEEAAMLCDEMESFCNDFSEIERKLKGKGVVVGNRISIAAPSLEYASIINVNDYDLDKAAQVSVITAHKKRRPVATQKTMRRDND